MSRVEGVRRDRKNEIGRERERERVREGPKL
jgi:hypothetical protein